MKTIKYLSMAAAALLMASCSNNENPYDGPVELRLTSGVEVQQSRAAANTQEEVIAPNEGVDVWVDDATDKTALYKANALTSDGSNGFTGGTPMFFPQTGNNIDIYAIHGTFTTPFTNGTAFPTTAQEFSVVADQSAGGSSYTGSDLLYAYDTDVARAAHPATTHQLTFYHMLSKLELAIKIGAGIPELAATGAVTLGGVVLNGDFTPSATVDMAKQDKRAEMIASAATATTGTMTLGQTPCTDFEETNVVYNEAIMVPQDMNGKVLTFKLANNGELKYTFKNTTFASGKKYLYHITLDLTGVTVTSEIKAWDPVSATTGTATMQ